MSPTQGMIRNLLDSLMSQVGYRLEITDNNTVRYMSSAQDRYLEVSCDPSAFIIRSFLYFGGRFQLHEDCRVIYFRV